MPWEPGKNLGDDQDYSGLPDDEIERAVREHLEADDTVDASDIEIRVENAKVRLTGHVGSEVERETAERVVADLLGLPVDADGLWVEPAAREGIGAAGEPDAGTAIGEPGEVSEAVGTEDPIEASDEGESWTPPDEPWAEALAATDPPHDIAADDPRQPARDPSIRNREGRRPPRVEEAVARVIKDEAIIEAPVTENAASFKERMRRVAEEREGRRAQPAGREPRGRQDDRRS